MSIRAGNGYLSFMAWRIERGIIQSGNPFVEVYLDSMDCSVEAELSQLRGLRDAICRNPDGDHSYSGVLDKYLFGWKEADRFLAVLHLRSSDQWAKGWYAAMRGVPLSSASA